MELTKITDEVYYIANGSNIGLIKQDKQAVLIDSGLDESSGQQILSLLQNKGLELIGIINTHSHADHCGGNNYLQSKTEAEIWAPKLEAEIIQAPYLEPMYLFSGAPPVNELENKFLMAEPSQIDKKIVSAVDKLQLGSLEIQIVPLPGHAPNQIGVAKDGVLFCADALFAPEVLAKHKIPFHMDIEQQKKTLNRLEKLDYNLYLPAHGELTEDIESLVAANLEIIAEVEADLQAMLSKPKTTEQILKEVCDQYNIQLSSQQKYYLMKTAVMAYLSSLSNREAIKTEIEANKLKWIQN